MAAPTTLTRPDGYSSFSPRTFRSFAWLPLCLLVVSIFTTASTGALLMQNFRLGQPPLVNEGDLVPLHWIWSHPSALASGWSFSVALLGILLAHEAGHVFYCRRHGIRASWPYVLPAPTLSGTAGAVIRIRSRIPSRRALIEVGIAGPIAGYLVALPTTIVGILLSAGRLTPHGSCADPVSSAMDHHAAGPDPRGLGSPSAAAGSSAAPPHPDRELGWTLCHLAQPDSRRPAGWRAYPVCDFAPMAPPDDVCRARAAAGHGRDPVDRMGAVGSDPAFAGNASSPRSVFPAVALQISVALRVGARHSVADVPARSFCRRQWDRPVP